MAQTLEDKMKTMAGFCCVCGDHIFEKVNGKYKKKDTYRDHILKLSNGTLMRIGVCDKDHAKLTSGNKVQATAKTVIDNHKIFWDNSPKWAPKNHQTITVTDPNTNLSKFKREKLLEKDKKVKK